MKKTTGFEKFLPGPKKGAAKKEEMRQTKRKWKKEFQEKKEAGKAQRRSPEYKFDTPSRKPQLEIRKSGKKTDDQGSKSLSIKKTTTAPGIKKKPESDGMMPLNKFIAHSGVCSRRDAAELVKGGKVKVNGELITEPGHKVSEGDDVRVAGKRVVRNSGFVYILLNKPKDYITTTEDPQQRKTVVELVKNATPDRIYPVGRLDRNTSGVLLLTNDGELAQKLTHPSNEIRKIYAVTLNKPLTKNHFDAILKGVSLEDGLSSVDALAFTDAQDHTQVGVEIHSGKNRIVRRLFEHFGYDVKNLDRVMFAGLTKKNVQRGKWRYLSEKEVRDLKFFKKGKR